jgi:hypothetical protein
MLGAQLADLAKVSHGRDNDSRLSLNWFEKNRSDVLSMELESPSYVFDFTISDGMDCVAIAVIRTHALEVWPESIPTLRVCAHAALIRFSSTRRREGRLILT